MARPSDQQLITAVLDATSTMSLRERQRATGISHYTFARFQNGPTSPRGWNLQGETREKIIRYLERVKKMPARAASAPLSDPERARLVELWEEMGRILRAG